MSEPLSLLTVHAHPDDEASKGAGTVARYHAEGIHCVLVCCTGGEEGEVLNPALDTPEVHARLPELRMEELDRSTRTIGYDEVVLLGYRDSGMPDSVANANPASFAQAPLDEAVGRLVGIVRRVRPQVMVIYGDEQSGYPHPDHLRVHDIGIAAFAAAGDPSRFPGEGAPWQPRKLYYTVFSGARFREVHEKFVELGLESPFDEEWRKRWEKMPPQLVTTEIDISGVAGVRREALLAHATQVDPTSKFWFGLPPEVMDGIHPSDDYQLARIIEADGTEGDVSAFLESVAGGDPAGREHDLFAGVRAEDRISRAEPVVGEQAVSRWLTDAWFAEVQAEAADLPTRPGASGRLTCEVTGGPEGDVRCHWVVTEGRIASAGLGAADDPEMVLTLTRDDARAVQQGTLDPSVAFMQGRMKAAGSMEVLLSLLPLSRDPEVADVGRRVAALTEF